MGFTRCIKRLTLVNSCLLFIAGGLHAQTAQQIISGWSALSGGQGGKVVYGGATQVFVMDLEIGVPVAVANFGLANTQFGRSGSYKFSPSGKRILAQNDQAAVVMNADGSNMKIIWQGAHPWDLISSAWDGDSAVVYSVYSKIVRTTVRADNTPGVTTDLLADPVPTGYCSVDKYGDYLCFVSIAGNSATRGYHRPCVKNLATGILRDLVPRFGDGCTVRLRPDNSGVTMLNVGSHLLPAPIKNFDTLTIDNIAPVTGLGMSGMRWSNKADYLVHMGDRAVDLPGGGTSQGYAWIRKVSTKGSVQVGTTVYYPDLWIGRDGGMSVQTPQIAPTTGSFATSISVEITTPTTGSVIYYTLDGKEPTQASIRYTSPFVLQSTVTVKARAFKDGLYPSTIAEKAYFNAVVIEPENPPNIVPGMNYTYYEGTWTSLPNFRSLTPVDSGTATGFSLLPRNRSDGYGFVFSGYISIVKDTFYTFFLSSDEGSKLFIGDSLVVNNDGIHTQQERSGTVALGAGRHAIRVEYFEATGSDALVVSYQGGGNLKTSIPASVLYRLVPSMSMELLAPNQAAAYETGDTIRLSWNFRYGTGMAAVVELSLDDGMTFPISLFPGPLFQKAERADTFWVVPHDPEFASDNARIRVYMYNNAPLADVSNSAFRLVYLSPVDNPVMRLDARAGQVRVGAGVIRFDPAKAERLVVLGVDGSVILACPINELTAALQRRSLPAGACVVRVLGKDSRPIAQGMATVTR